MKHYDALSCFSDRETLDLIVALSTRFAHTGILDNDNEVVLYFDQGEFDPAFLDELQSWLPGDRTIRFELGTVDEQNWNAEFESSLEPVRVADRLTITQSWNPVTPETPDHLVVVIDPKMSFGTGHHESTRLISRLMLGLDFTGRRVLDIGTGTGALAIIAEKLGAEYILAFDNNEWAVANTAENLERNGSSDRVKLIEGELADIDDAGYDIILANLHRNLIIELMHEIVAKQRDQQSVLLTSGVLIDDYEGLLESAATNGLVPIAEERENEWIATLFGRAA